MMPPFFRAITPVLTKAAPAVAANDFRHVRSRLPAHCRDDDVISHDGRAEETDAPDARDREKEAMLSR